MGAVALTRGAGASRAVMARHGKSFAWAARLLGVREAADAARLYAFCRGVDDLADEADPPEGAARLAALRRDLEEETGADAEVRDFLALARETGLSLAAARHFVDAAAGDLGCVRIPDEAALVRYGYGVAGTVGLMMCSVLRVREPRALPFAIDLGVAMQLTNVARDVLEDAKRGRRYLPASLLPAPVEPEAVVGADAAGQAELLEAVHRVLDLADRYYRSADRGMRFLPRRARLGILTASRVYEAIGSEIRRRGTGALEERAVVGRGGKLWHTLRALGAFVFDPRTWNLGPAPAHAAGLHAPLRHRPGTSRAA